MDKILINRKLVGEIRAQVEEYGATVSNEDAKKLFQHIAALEEMLNDYGQAAANTWAALSAGERKESDYWRPIIERTLNLVRENREQEDDV